MRQDLPCACVRWSALLALWFALSGAHDAFAVPVSLPAPALIAKTTAAKSTAGSKSTAKSKRTLRQFTGIVTALDKGSLTVEKSGKKARSMVFVRDESTKTTGDLEKDARVTVYYRERDGHSVAQRVVVKSDDTSTSTER